MERSGKKAVRFSSPFETDSSKVDKLRSVHTGGECTSRTLHQIKVSASQSAVVSSDSFSGDSWDAFDAKMSKSKRVVPKVVENQFLEMSSSQNKSLNLGDENFFSLSFQDAKNLIDRDESERLQFMNSNVSFSQGIDQVEAPSLLSITSYFQQGSSFPVPYVGNDSTMFGQSLAGVSLSDFSTPGQLKEQPSLKGSRRSSRGLTSINEFSPKEESAAGTSFAKNDLSRNDSLAKFFLGPQSNGMNKVDIMEYVMDYCKRRASFRLSDAPDIVLSPLKEDEKTPPVHDVSGFSGIEKTVIDNSKEDLMKNQSVVKGEQIKQSDISVQNSYNPEPEKSLILSEGGSMKKAHCKDLLDVSGGFEKFKKNLHLRRTSDERYRHKMRHHHQDFEKKRLNVDERYSHPKLSPKGFEKPGSTASLERPSKKVIFNSPPQKLVSSRIEKKLNVNTPNAKLMQETEYTTGQCHSTPVFNDPYITKLRTTNVDKGIDVGDCGDVHRKPATESESNSSCVFASPNHGDLQCAEEVEKMTTEDENVCGAQPMEINSDVKRPMSLSNDLSRVLKPSNFPEGLSVVPVIHSGTPQCSCPHQCGQQPTTHGMLPGVPVVIHIHLPCGITTTGTVMHPVPTHSAEQHPK